MSEILDRIREALAKYDEGMAAIGGCGDGNCVVFKRGGMHTNGGCNCYSDRMTATRAMSRGRWLAEEIRKAVTVEARPLPPVSDSVKETT